MEDLKKKYESDLTSKEKWQLELQKLKKMNLKQKIIYIFDYYKFVFVWIVIIFIFICLGIQIYQNSKKIELLSVAIVDVRYDKDEESERLKSDLLEYMGSGEKNEEITLDTSAMSGEDYTATIKMTIVMGTGTTDIVICDEDTYNKYEEQGVQIKTKALSIC